VHSSPWPRPDQLLLKKKLLAHVSIDLEVIFYPEKQIKTTPIPDFLLEMVRVGGLINSLKQRQQAGAFSHA
jgi:hypothetical protein